MKTGAAGIRWTDRRFLGRTIAIVTFLVLLWQVRPFVPHEILIRYEAPPGDLSVVLQDGDGDRLRRTWFPRTPREHTVSLQTGQYTVIFELSDGRTAACPLRIVDEHPVVVEWCGR